MNFLENLNSESTDDFISKQIKKFKNDILVIFDWAVNTEILEIVWKMIDPFVSDFTIYNSINCLTDIKSGSPVRKVREVKSVIFQKSDIDQELKINVEPEISLEPKECCDRILIQNSQAYSQIGKLTLESKKISTEPADSGDQNQ